MTKSRDLLTPFIGGEFNLADGKLTFRKQILPLGSINYEGRKLHFDRAMHKKLIAAFQDQAYDQVPFVLADGDNRHNEFAENFRGVVKDVTLEQPGEEPGLYATIAFPNKKLARAVLDNSELGVSCRLREFVEKADGRQYDIALRHVCGTLDPKVTGMSPWQRMDLSDSGYSDRTVVDLTSATYQEDKMPKTKKRADTKTVDLAQLAAEIEEMDDDEVREFIDQQLADLSDDADDDGPDDDADDDIVDSSDDEDDEDDGDPDEDEDDADLSEDARLAIDLANSRAALAQSNADRALQLLADQRWESEQERLLKAGVPKEIVDLAEPFFHVKEPMFVDLTDGKTLNASSRVKKIVEKMAGYLALDGPRGHAVDLAEKDGQAAKDKQVLDQWSTEYGD